VFSRKTVFPFSCTFSQSVVDQLETVVKAIGKPGRRCSDGLARGQVAVMREHIELSRANPVLEEPGVDVHERRALDAGEQSGVDRIVKIQQQVRPSQHRFGLGPAASDEAEGADATFLRPVERIEERPPLEPESPDPFEKGRE
jgi:hypothetical protein